MNTTTLSSLVALLVGVVLILPAATHAQQSSSPVPLPSCGTSALYGSPGSYTFTVPAGVTEIRATAIGGGGGGGAGSGGWGSGGGGGCGGAVAGGTISVTPGQKIPLYVGYGGTGGNGTNQTGAGGCPWCGTYDPSSNGSAGGTSGIDSITAAGGSWGRTGYYNLFNNYKGGTGGGSGGGGGGNGWYIIYGAPPGHGGTAGGQTNSYGAGGYCTGGGWSINPANLIKNGTVSAGAGGYAPSGNVYWGGGGGGGLVINDSTVTGGSGVDSVGNGGHGYGAGGGAAGLAYRGAGGNGASGAVYIEWDGGEVGSCALSCSVTFDQNPLNSSQTTVRWSSSNASLFYINNIGYVGSTGSAVVYAPGDYSGAATGIGATASCPAVLSGDNQCTPETTLCGADNKLYDSCGVTRSCQYGCSTETNQCNEKSACVNYLSCNAEGTRVINSCDGTTSIDCAAIGKKCVTGSCVIPSVSFESFEAPQFTASGHVQAFPSLVRSGESTNLYWNVANAASCAITGSNGDGLEGSATGVWNTLFSGNSGKMTSPILGNTTYRLRCTALTGAIPSTVEETATVNILPVFQEL